VLAELLVNPAPLLHKANKASQFALSNYTPQREQQDILTAWGDVFKIAIARRQEFGSFRSAPPTVAGCFGDFPIAAAEDKK